MDDVSKTFDTGVIVEFNDMKTRSLLRKRKQKDETHSKG